LEGNTVAGQIFVRHDAAGHARYQALKQLARSQRRILEGAPGLLKRRTRRGTEYWVREFNAVGGRKTDEHLGTVADVSDARRAQAQAEIDLARALTAGASALRLFGYQRVERRTAAVLAALYNHDLYRAGLTLVGSHAYGALVNEYGISAPAYSTQDIDLARRQPLEMVLPADLDFRKILGESGLEFVPVPGMPSRQPSGSFKIAGADALSVDLLIPGKNLGKVVAVDDLRAHAQEIPLLEFLVKDSVDAIAVGPNHVVPVRVPAPERFVLHKLLSSQERKTNREKIRKDLEQAAVLAAVIEEDTPEILKDTFGKVPASARAAIKRGAKAAARILDGHAAATVLGRIAGS
jgi:hypothetical protein